ncbi:MAG: serine/threonine-protein kinase [Phycisphaerae bacterium]
MDTVQTLEVPGYEVVQFLGSGARSTIWKVRESRTGDIYALKRVVKRKSSDTRFLDQAINEYEVAKQLDHPVIRKIYHLRRRKHWLSVREILLVMELCEGLTIQSDPPKDVREVLRIFHEVSVAIQHMNTLGFVHADMKPNNIVIAPDGTVKIIDLGQSCRIGSTKQRIQGTPDFIAPEQVLRRPLDPRTDVFNLGASMYWTLTGEPMPTVLPKKGGAVTLVGEPQVSPPSEINPEVPDSLSKLVMHCIRPKPSARPANMEKVVSRLEVITHSLNLSHHADSGGGDTLHAEESQDS